MAYREIRFKSNLHRKIKEAIWERYKLSWNQMEPYRSKWNKDDKRAVAYLKETENDRLRRSLRNDGKPQFTTIEVPYSYAILMTLQTYWTTVFLGRDPVFQYMSRHGEPQMRVQALEALIAYQTLVGEQLAPYYIWLLDAAKYGLGVVCTYWSNESVVVSNIEERPETYLGIPVPGRTKKVRVAKKIPGYRGHRVFNVRPQDFLPDPRVPIKDLQRGEFCGRIFDSSWNELVKRQQRGELFNLDIVKERRRNMTDDRDRQDLTSRGDPLVQIPDPNQPQTDILDMGFHSIIEMVIELVPEEWGLGTTKFPEKWVFTLVDQEVICGAQPLGEIHGKFPYAVQQYEMDGYIVNPRSLPEVLSPLNDALSWLINTHFHSVRKVINDQLVVDPSKIVMKDCTDPASGRLIRLRPEAYGTDARLAVHQLQTVDVTQNHLKDSQIIAEMMQRVSGVTDNVMGMVNAGGRKTATEVRTSSTFGVNRLKTHSEYNSALAWTPLSQMFVSGTQQHYDAEQTFKIAGDLLPGSPQQMMITPEDIAGFYDFVPVDGTMPVDKFAMANLWREIMAQMAKIPDLMAQYSIGQIFSYTAKLAGAVNIDQFRLDVNVVPDKTLTMEEERGNVVPIGGSDVGGNVGTTAGEVESRAGNVAEPGQVGGLGTTG